MGCFDGALIEISTDDAQTWTPIPNNLLINTSYTGVISTSYGNPLGGSEAWCGMQDWEEAIIDLTAYAGQDIYLRFTQSTDTSIGYHGWSVDDFMVQSCTYRLPFMPAVSPANLWIGQEPGQTTSIQLKLTNAGLNPDIYDIALQSEKWQSDLTTKESIPLNPGESIFLEIVVEIPANTAYGEMDHISLSITSLNDPASPPASFTAVINIMAAVQHYLPMMTQIGQ